MIRYDRLAHEFVANVPERLEPGRLYISIEYATAAHLCCCGCGAEVVTPFTPTDWKMTFDGETISLWPSIGNWNEACRSHYVIDRSEVIEAPPWSDRRIEAESKRDKAAKGRFYRRLSDRKSDVPVPATVAVQEPLNVWSRAKRWLKDWS
jgi:hypothetical protein